MNMLNIKNKTSKLKFSYWLPQCVPIETIALHYTENIGIVNSNSNPKKFSIQSASQQEY